MYKSQNINSLANIEKDDSVVLLDVRTPAEYAEGHIEDSLNIDVMSPDFMSKIESLDKNKTYYVICRSGGRSASACNAMASVGFKDLTNMEGGMMSWMGKIATL